MAKEMERERPPERGRPITARYLQNTTRRIEQLERGGGAPKSLQPQGSAPESTETPSANPGNESWSEVSRTTTTVRITNPSDAAQFVDVERVVTITFNRGDGTTVVLNLD